jgi:hydrogenase maturation protease
VLYEGYILYPYRPSVKNTQRWTFGGLYPRDFCLVKSGRESPSMQTQCLLLGHDGSRIDVTIRFLHLTTRQVGKLAGSAAEPASDEEPPLLPVPSLSVDGRQFHSWQEAVEEKVSVDGLVLGELVAGERRTLLEFPGSRTWEPIESRDGRPVGAVVRRRHALLGSLTVAAARLADGCFRLTVKTVNETPLAPPTPHDRDEALLRSFAAAHAAIAVEGGEFVSQIDPPARWRELASANENIGAWPVLVGEPPDRTCLLSAPIILYDYPQIAPESPGGLFDSTEIDEILSLRIMTLTEAEKESMCEIDPRSRDLLRRVESLAPESLFELHGMARDVNARNGE